MGDRKRFWDAGERIWGDEDHRVVEWGASGPCLVDKDGKCTPITLLESVQIKMHNQLCFELSNVQNDMQRIARMM